MREQKIMKRVQEHYDYLIGQGYDVVCLCLQGSQNYDLDEYSDEYQSDIDTKAIVLPPLDDYINAATPISKVLIMENNEHIEVKDIRVMFEMFKKANLSYIELLYTEFKIINPKWKDFIQPLFDNKDVVASYNRNQFLRCIAGMAMEKRKALCHPYPNIVEKIEKYGYDGKQLHHCVRLYSFIDRYTRGEPLEKCYKVKNLFRWVLMNYKKQLDAYGQPMSAENAISACDYYVEEIRKIKDANLSPHDEINQEAVDLLKKLQYNIIKEKLRRELDDERSNE